MYFLDLPISSLSLFCPEEDAATWAKKNCKSFVSAGIVTSDNNTYRYRYFFYCERDKIAFTLRWL
jgi:hypothetical protein